MDNLLLYLLKSQLSLVLLFSLYMLLLRKHTYFRFNRLFLLLSLFASALIPLINFSFINTATLYYVQLPEIVVGAEQHAGETIVTLTTTNLLLLIYAIISFVILLKMIWDFVSIIRLLLNVSTKKVLNKEGIYYRLNSLQNFSFFNWIFIRVTDENKNSIIEHEKAHSRLYHSLDIVIIKLYQSLFWFNPLSFIIERELRLQHEYEVDQWVLRKHKNVLDYQQILLNQVFQTEFNLFTNNFNQSFLKNRFTMMTKRENKKRKPLLLALIASAMIIPFIFSCSMESKRDTEIIQQAEEPTEPEKPTEKIIEKQSPVIDTNYQDKTFTIVEKMPSFSGGEQALYQYIAKNINYPEAAKKAGIEGRCFVSFVIEKDGSVSEVEIIRSTSYGLKQKEKVEAAKLCDTEALRVIKNMPSWEPGEENGKKVRVAYRMPINFKLK